jgi:dTMP kinase
MLARGKFIAIEGIDGSGKRTQTDLLSHVLECRSIPLVRFSFPRYESTFGRLVARFLNGDFGKLEDVDAHLSALLYAGDRFEAKPQLEAALAQGKNILTDRYIASNLAHQTARVPLERRTEFMDWLRRTEYEIYGLPTEDLVIYLRLPANEAQRLVGLKGVREYTTRERDLQESSLAHLQQATEIYDLLAREPNWVTVECFDGPAKALRSPDAIHAEVLAAVESLVSSGAATR